MVKILVIAGDFVEDLEIYSPVQALQAFGFEVYTVSPGKKTGDKIKTAIHDFEGDQTYTEKTGHQFSITADFDSANVGDYDGLYIPGGRAPEFLRLDEGVIALTRAFFEAGKPVASICHGVQVLTAAGVLKGRTSTGYYACGPEVTQAGATYKKVTPTEAVVDGNLVTAVAWPAHGELVKEFVNLLGYKVVPK